MKRIAVVRRLDYIKKANITSGENMNFQDVLNTVTAGSSDYATAKKLGITRGTFSKYRCGTKTPSDETLDKIIEISGLEPIKVYLAVYAEKIHNPSVAEQFRTLATH